MFTCDPKPALWAFDPAAVDPAWYDFWGSCVACVPAWENLSGGNPPAVLGSAIGNLSYGVQFCTKNGTPGWSISTQGPALINTGSTTSWMIPHDNSTGSQFDILPTTSATLLFVRQKLSTSIALGSNFGLGVAGTPVAAWFGGHMPYLDGVVYWDFGATSSPNRLTWSGYVPSTAVECWAFVAGTKGSAIYFNGVKRASQTTPLTRSKINAGGVNEFGFTSGNTLGNADLANILFVAILNVEWTAGQVSEWAQDPYAPIRMSIDISGAQIAAAALGMQSIIYM